MNGIIKWSLAVLVLVVTACSNEPSRNSESGDFDEFGNFQSSGSGDAGASPEASVENEMLKSSQANNTVAPPAADSAASAPPADSAAAAPPAVDNGAGAPAGSEFAQFDEPPPPPIDTAKTAEPPKAAEAPKDEFSQFDVSTKPDEKAKAAEAPKDEFSQFDAANKEAEPPPPIPTSPAPETAQAPPPPVIDEVPAPTIENSAPAPEAPANKPAETAANEPSSKPVKITNIQYKANDNGGSVVISGNGPLAFQSRLNPDSKQFIVEIPNSKLPAKLKRTLNTKDFQGPVGAIDAYQSKDSGTRIVVQLRDGAPEPVVQAEGNQLFVVAQGTATAAATPAAPPAPETAAADSPPAPSLVPDASSNGTPPPEEGPPADTEDARILESRNLQDYLNNNINFYGKKISIEVDDVNVRDVIRLIGEEANVNLVQTDGVKGRISLKLKDVPWDQALVMVMKATKLGYIRSGNVLRISPVADIKSEEDDNLKYAQTRRAEVPLKVKTISVNYAKVEDLESQLKPLLSPRGSVSKDTRTTSMIITDIDENVERIEKLIRTMDVPPQQVLIEGKIVEASDNFERDIGINWSASGQPYSVSGLASATGGSAHGSTGLNISPVLGDNSSLGMNFTLGTLDILGDLSAQLRLFENQGLVKVISSPRVLTLHNEDAEITEITQIPIITATVLPTGGIQPSVQFKDAKLRLNVKPQVTNDGAVIMQLDVGRDVVGPVVDQKTQARSIDTRETKSKVIVKNSQTAVIGGLYINDMSESENRVPWLGTLPIVGWLFKSKSVSNQRTELLIFVTPRIIGQLEGAPSSMPNNDSGGTL